MGMFDAVMFECPICNASMEAQSRAGECILRTFSSVNVPPKIATSLDGELVHCEACDRVWTIALVMRTEYELTVFDPNGRYETADEEVELLEKRLAAAKARQHRETK